MVTNDERREVARRLRKAIGLTGFAEALGFNWTDDSDWVWKDVSNLVADLIEPPRQCPHYNSDRHYCSVHDDAIVDREALLALADEISDTSCDNRGELSVSLGDIWGWSQAIREALGVSDA